MVHLVEVQSGQKSALPSIFCPKLDRKWEKVERLFYLGFALLSLSLPLLIFFTYYFLSTFTDKIALDRTDWKRKIYVSDPSWLEWRLDDEHENDDDYPLSAFLTHQTEKNNKKEFFLKTLPPTFLSFGQLREMLKEIINNENRMESGRGNFMAIIAFQFRAESDWQSFPIYSLPQCR